MRITLNIVASLLVLAGAIWFLQGINVLPGSFMTGQLNGRSMAVSPLQRGSLCCCWLTGCEKSVDELAQSASGSGRIWKWTTLGFVPFPVSLWNGVRVPHVVQTPFPFQAAFGSSKRPSIPLAKKPMG